MDLASAVVSLAALVGAFAMGRWSTIGGPSALRLKKLSDVAPEVAPLLYSPPAGHGEVAVPSTVRDVRGEVHNLRFGGFRFNVLVSKAGAVRSGDVHRSDQLDLIFSGCVRLPHQRCPSCRLLTLVLRLRTQACSRHHSRARQRSHARVRTGTIGGHSEARPAHFSLCQRHSDGGVVGRVF